MSNGFTRRDWLKLIGGSAVGLMFTPIPWKVLDDSAKWTQNWSWTPTPPNGRINFRFTTCTLCPAACGLRARCVEDQPVSLSGIPRHPLSRGSLCPIGLGGHLLPSHPSRLRQPFRRIMENGEARTAPLTIDESVSEISNAIFSSRRTGGSIAILDMQPQRTISYAYRNFLSKFSNGVYVVPDQHEGVPVRVVDSILGPGRHEYGIDTRNVRTIISFRTPVLDGWGTAGQSSELTRRHAAGSKNPLRVIQVESTRSRSAELADEWVAVKPGMEAIFAIGLMHIMKEEKLCDFKPLGSVSRDRRTTSGSSFVDTIDRYTPDEVAGATGVSGGKIIEVARELAKNKPSLVLFSGDPGGGPFGEAEELVFMSLNLLLGAVGDNKPIIPRNNVPVPARWKKELAAETLLSKIPDHSIKILIMDGSESGYAIPWPLIRQKLQTTGPVVVSLSPHLAGAATHADYLIPSPANMETHSDSPTPAGYPYSSYSLSIPILTPPEKTIHPLEFLKRIAGVTIPRTDELMVNSSMAVLLKERADNIFKLKAGNVFDASSGKNIELGAIASSEKFMTVLANGGCWINEEQPKYSLLHQVNPGSTMKDPEAELKRLVDEMNDTKSDRSLILLPCGSKGAGSFGQSHPLMSKIFKESDLRMINRVASVNPRTGIEKSLAEGGNATITTQTGKIDVIVLFDESIMPGIIQAAVGPGPGSFTRIEGQPEQGILDICKIESDSTWKTTKAEITPS